MRLGWDAVGRSWTFAGTPRRKSPAPPHRRDPEILWGGPFLGPRTVGENPCFPFYRRPGPHVPGEKGLKKEGIELKQGNRPMEIS